MSFDLTNKNIKDTFQNLLQRTGSDNRLYDLKGNEIGDLRISGSLVAQQYIVSSSVTNISIATLSGSTKFGDSTDDTHQFTGSVSIFTGTTGNDMKINFQEEGTHKQAIVFQETTSPTFAIQHDGSDSIPDAQLKIRGNGGSGATIDTDLITIQSNGDTKFIGNMTASGKVKIETGGGSLSPHSDTDLFVGQTNANSTTATIQIAAGNTGFSNLLFSDTDSYNVGGFQYVHDGNVLNTRVGGSVVQSIDASGNITASGNISASGTLFSSNLRGVSNALNLYPATSTDAGRIQLAQSDTTFYQTIRPGLDKTHRLGISTLRWSELNVNHITASGDISGSITSSLFIGTASIGTSANTSGYNVEIHGGIHLEGDTGTSNHLKFDVNRVSNNNSEIHSRGNTLFIRNDGEFGLGKITHDANIVELQSSQIILNGAVTASGNISASGDGFFDSVKINSGDASNMALDFKGANPTGVYYDGTNFVWRREGSTAVSLGVNNIGFGGGGNSKISAVTNTSITINGGGTETIFNAAGVSGSGTGSFSEGRFSGFVGIGTQTPVSTLDITGDMKISSHITASGNISASGVSSFGDNMSIIKNNNGDDVSLTIRNSAVAGSTDETVSLKFGHIAAGGGGKIVSGREGTYTVGAASDSNLQIYTTLNGSDTEKMRIDSDGNVGIGTTTPTKKLEVEGDISASGDVFAHSGSFNYITASIIDVDGDTIRMGGEPFTKANILTLKQGRSLKPLRAGKSKPDFEAEDGTFDGNVVANGNVSASGTVFGNDIKVGATSVVKSVTQIADSVAQQGKITFVNAAGSSVTKRISNLRSTASPTFNNITASGDIFNTHVVQMTNSSSVVDTFNTSSHQTCKYLLQVTSASVIQSSEMLVIQKDSNALNTEFAQINSGINLVNFSTIVNNSNVELIGSSSFISCSVKFNRVLI